MKTISLPLISFTFLSIVGFGQPLYLSDFQYFSESEISGGGPYTGSYVTFGPNDLLEGFVHTNGELLLSSAGCPQFLGFVEAVNGIDTSACSPDDVFLAGYNAAADSFYLPTNDIVDELAAYATHLFIADSMIGRHGLQDSLIMTELEFTVSGFNVNQWSYIIPPIMGDSSEFNEFAYYHNHAESGEACQMDGFHHFDFPAPENPADFIMYQQFFSDTSAIIHIQGGQLQVSGVVYGQYVIITDEKTEYLRPDSSGIADYCYNNIWIIDDIIYTDSQVNGEVSPGSASRLGLVSGANIIVANTIANGGGNAIGGPGVIINAALVTLNGSFVAHYWQNTCDSLYSFPDFEDPSLSKGDGRGHSRMGVVTGDDSRGVVNLWGALIQNKRGFMKRNNPGPYAQTIGYDKNYHYDPNFLVSPPPGFEDLINPLMAMELGDVDLNTIIEDQDGDLVLDFLVGLETLDNVQILNANVSLDYSISSFDASIIYQYVADVIDTLPSFLALGYGSGSGSISMPDGEISVDDSISIPIRLSGGTDIVAFETTIIYDPLYLNFDEFNLSSLFTGFGLSSNSEPGIIVIASAGSSFVEGDGEIGNLEFTVNSMLPGDETTIMVSSHRWNESEIQVNPATATLSVIVGSESTTEIPERYELKQNYPNPFNPNTTIRYALPHESNVDLTIYDISGRELTSLANGIQKAGRYSINWDGRDGSGNAVPAGIYLCRLELNSYSKTIKMAYLR